MRPLFVDTSRVAVTADGEIDVHAVTPDMDVIYIRKRMDFGTKSKVISAFVEVSGLDVGALQLALAQHNILDWSGPGFGGVPCNAKTIAQLDPDHPLLIKALECIAARNPMGAKPDPKSMTAGAASGPGAGPEPAGTTSTSSAPTTSAGRRNRSTRSTRTTPTN